MKKITILSFLLSIFVVSSVLAYGPNYVRYSDSGNAPCRWKGGKIGWIYDAGEFSGKIPGETTSASVQKKCSDGTLDPCAADMKTCGIMMCVKKKLNDWKNVVMISQDADGKNVNTYNTVDLNFSGAQSVGEDIKSGESYQKWKSKAIRDKMALIVLDEDGSIIADEVGDGNGKYMLGLTLMSDDHDKGTCGNDMYYAFGATIFNGLFLDGEGSSSTGDEVGSAKEYSGTVIHELGHLIGLDHTQPLREVLGSSAKTTAADPENVPTMYPILISAFQSDLHKDDMVGISYLYGNDNFKKKFCTVEGDLKNEKDGTPLQGVNVIAYSADENDKHKDARSFVSGALAMPGSANGHYILQGLLPGKKYNVVYEAVLNDFQGLSRDGNSLGACINPYCNPDKELLGPSEGDLSKAANQISSGFTCTNTENPTVMPDTSAPAASDPKADTGSDSDTKKGWCMSIAGGFSPVWGLVFPAAITGLIAVRRRLKKAK